MRTEKIRASSLRPGDKFQFVPRCWRTPAVVLESYASGDLWALKYSHPSVVNPPGVWYGDRDAPVRRKP